MVKTRVPKGALALHLSRPNSVFTLQCTLLCAWFSSGACGFAVFAGVFPPNRRWRCRACRQGFLKIFYTLFSEVIIGLSENVRGFSEHAFLGMEAVRKRETLKIQDFKSGSIEKLFFENTQTFGSINRGISQTEHIEAVFGEYFRKISKNRRYIEENTAARSASKAQVSCTLQLRVPKTVRMPCVGGWLLSVEKVL